MQFVIYLALLIVSTAISYALAPKPESPNPASLDDFDFPTAEEGRAVPVVFGTVRITGPNVIWYGDLGSEAIRGGGVTLNTGLLTAPLVGSILGPLGTIAAGFKKKKKKVQQQTVGYWYTMGLHLALCYGEVDEILKIEADDKEAWAGSQTANGNIQINKPDLFGGASKEGGLVLNADVCMGGASQTKNAYLVSKLGSSIPAFRGLCCLVMSGKFTANSTSIKPLAITTKRIVKGWRDNTAWYSAKSAINLLEMNPVHIIYQSLTDNEWGMGYPTSAIDDADFRLAADALHTEGFGLSLMWNRQSSIQEFIQEICNHIGGALRLDPKTGLFQLKLIRADYVTASLDVFDESNISELQSFQRAGYGESANEVTITYTDPDSKKQTAITAHNLANIQAQGVVITQKNNYLGINNHDIAKRVVLRDLITRSTLLSKVKFTVNRHAWKLIGGDVFRFSWPKLNLTNVVMRVGSISTGTLDNGLITIEAVEDVFGLPDNGYLTQQTGNISTSITPAPSVYRKFIEASYFELESVQGDAWVNGINPSSGYVSMMCQASSIVNIDYEFLDRISGIGEYFKVDDASHCPTAQIVSNLDQAESSTLFINNIVGNFSSYATGMYAVINDEYVRVDALDVITGELTLSRGVIDTVPVAHPAGSVIFFAEMYTAYDVLQSYPIGTAIEAKVLTKTNSGTLDLSLAPVDSLTVQARHNKPYPPAKIRINGSYKPASAVGELTISWEHRNRISQSVDYEQPISQTLTGITSEAGVTYEIFLFNLNFTMSRTLTGLTGTSYTYPIHEEMANFGGYQSHLTAFIFSRRDGLTCWRAHIFTFERLYIAQDKDLATPPASPIAGDIYIIAASPTGTWAGHATHITVWNGLAWVFYSPINGWRFYVADEIAIYSFNGTAWVIV